MSFFNRFVFDASVVTGAATIHEGWNNNDSAAQRIFTMLDFGKASIRHVNDLHSSRCGHFRFEFEQQLRAFDAQLTLMLWFRLYSTNLLDKLARASI